MDLKNKVKDFFTLGRRGNGGFTLVELIVVIAILAILGGVAVPAYSGYVKKAERAADEALLKEVNTAFAAACAINGQSHIGRTTNPTLTLNVDFSDNDGDVDDSFDQFFEGEEDAGFKTMSRIVYESTMGMFVGYGATLKDGVDWSDLSSINFWGSSYANSGIDGLAGTVDNLTTLLADSNALTLLRTMPGFAEYVSEKFGLDPDTADSQALGNAAVFFVADKLGNLDATALQSAIKEDIKNKNTAGLDACLDACFGDSAIQKEERDLVKASLQYGMVKGYIDSLADDAYTNILDENGVQKKVTGKEAKEWFASQEPTNLTTTNNIITAVTGSSDQPNRGYQTYIVGTTGATDINTFVDAMGAISNKTDAFETIEGSGLFSSQDVQDILNQYLGGK